MPNDAQKFSPIEQAMLIALYQWEYQPPADDRSDFKSALHAVPYEFLVAELLEAADDDRYPRRSGLWNDEATLALKSLEVMGLVSHFGPGHSLGWFDPGCDEYRGFSEYCEGAWRLKNGLLLICGLRIEQEDDFIQIENNSQSFYKLSEAGMPIARRLYFASEDQNSEGGGAHSPRRAPNATEQAVLDLLCRKGFTSLEAVRSVPKEERPTAERLAQPAIGRDCDGQFKTTLGHMVDLGWLDNGRNHGIGSGYFLTGVGARLAIRQSVPSQD